MAHERVSKMSGARRLVLRLSCPDREGIVAAVSGCLRENRCNIVEAQQFGDLHQKQFFMRVVLDSLGDPGSGSIDGLKAAFAGLAGPFGIQWVLRAQSELRRVMILVSKFDHCLVDLLYRKRIGELPMEITGVVSNHGRENYSHVDLYDTPFHHLPVTPETKREQEQRLLSLISDSKTELVVLARYMQILSQDLSRELSMRCINIHHSFLPGFKGAKPYHQAYKRGVKLIGATAHYVTEDLDEGPIIEQDVERISHADDPDSLVRKGRDVERRVLARAVHYHLEDRILLNGGKTVVFPN
jgi:formyltetrahydrofolate deformylase